MQEGGKASLAQVACRYDWDAYIMLLMSAEKVG
jgi:hypothetical protein